MCVIKFWEEWFCEMFVLLVIDVKWVFWGKYIRLYLGEIREVD